MFTVNNLSRVLPGGGAATQGDRRQAVASGGQDVEEARPRPGRFESGAPQYPLFPSTPKESAEEEGSFEEEEALSQYEGVGSRAGRGGAREGFGEVPDCDTDNIASSSPRESQRNCVGVRGDPAAGGESPCVLSGDTVTPQASSIRALLQSDPTVIQYVFQLEKAPTTGHLHYQGYVRLSAPRGFSYVRALLPAGVHWELAYSTHEKCVAYCKKDESRVDGPWEYGWEPEPGKRNDIVLVRELIDAGKGMKDVVEAVDSYQAMKCAELMLKHKEKKRDFKPDVRWYHGSTGTGKTRAALEEFPDAWISGRNLRWWEGYDAHEAVVIDDFRRDFCTFHELLRILDRYPYRVETKGASRQLLAKTIIITCPWEPSALYESRSSEDLQQLLRRIDTVRLYGDYALPPPVSNTASAGSFRSSV